MNDGIFGDLTADAIKASGLPAKAVAPVVNANDALNNLLEALSKAAASVESAKAALHNVASVVRDYGGNVPTLK